MKNPTITIFCNSCGIPVGQLMPDCLNTSLDVITFACPECNSICFSQTKENIRRMFNLPAGSKVDFNKNGEIWDK